MNQWMGEFPDITYTYKHVYMYIMLFSSVLLDFFTAFAITIRLIQAFHEKHLKDVNFVTCEIGETGFFSTSFS